MNKKIGLICINHYNITLIQLDGFFIVFILNIFIFNNWIEFNGHSLINCYVTSSIIEYGYQSDSRVG